MPVEMTSVDVLERVRALRRHGRTPKEIARCLGMSPARVAPLVRAVAAEDHAGTSAEELVECWVSPGWSRGLAVGDHPDWPDVDPDSGGPSGVACVLVTRRARRSHVSVCGYLVDVFCLGVKDALGPRVMSERDLYAFRRGFFHPFPQAPLTAPLELAQHLVLGAVEFAQGLGFQPHPDFAAAVDHLGRWTGPSDITFGSDGEPFYMQGPYDDAGNVLATLRRTVGQGNFQFMVGAPAL